jgi:hypothetical protein
MSRNLEIVNVSVPVSPNVRSGRHDESLYS